MYAWNSNLVHLSDNEISIFRKVHAIYDNLIFYIVYRNFSFKERGACYALLTLTEEEKKNGVVTASLGNHSQALSYHAGRLGIPTTVIMPVVAPLVKVEACKRYGATAIVTGEDMTEAKAYALKYCEENGLRYING